LGDLLAVGHDDHQALAGHAGDQPSEQLLGLAVEVCARFVEEQDRSAGDQDPGHREPGSLTGGEGASVLRDRSVEPARQARDHLGQTDVSQRRSRARIVGIGASAAPTLSRMLPLTKTGCWGSHATRSSPSIGVDLSQVDTIDGDPAGVWAPADHGARPARWSCPSRIVRTRDQPGARQLDLAGPQGVVRRSRPPHGDVGRAGCSALSNRQE
jgi:hypothetical protein